MLQLFFYSSNGYGFHPLRFLKYFFQIDIESSSTKRGIPIQIISLLITSNPHSLKNFWNPIGETLIGRQGKKYLEFSKGEKNATPSPPVVIASSKEWDAVHRAK